MAREGQAAQCRRGLNATLGAVHRFTTGALSVRGQLLHRMNAVLYAAFDSNFGARSSDAIGELYETIDREQYRMLNCLDDMPLLFFARSFAAVLQEAVRQLSEKRNTVSVSVSVHDTVSEDSWKCDTQYKELIVWEEKKDPEAPPVAAAPATPAAPAAQPLAALSNKEIWRREMQREHPWSVLDFSDAAIEGRIMIYDVPRPVLEKDLTDLLRPFGPLLDFYYRHDGFAHAKLKSNQTADEAVRRLNGTMLKGIAMSVKRARFLSRPRPGSRREYAYNSRMQLLECRRDCNFRSNDDGSADPPPYAARAADAVERVAAAVGGVACGRIEREDEIDEDLRDDVSSCDSCFSVD